MSCRAAWVWFCLSTEFVVVPLVGVDLALSGIKGVNPSHERNDKRGVSLNGTR